MPSTKKITLNTAQRAFDQALNENNQPAITQFMLTGIPYLYPQESAMTMDSRLAFVDAAYHLVIQQSLANKTLDEQSPRKIAALAALPYLLLALCGIESRTGMLIDCLIKYPEWLNRVLPETAQTVLMTHFNHSQPIHDQLLLFLIFHPDFSPNNNGLGKKEARTLIGNHGSSYQRTQLAKRLSWGLYIDLMVTDELPTNYQPTVALGSAGVVAKQLCTNDSIDEQLFTNTDLILLHAGTSCLATLCHRLNNCQLEKSIRTHYHKAVVVAIQQCITQNNWVQLKQALGFLANYEFHAQITDIQAASHYQLLQLVIELPAEMLLHYYPKNDPNNVYSWLMDLPDEDLSLCEDSFFLVQLCDDKIKSHRQNPALSDEARTTANYHLALIKQQLFQSHYEKAIQQNNTALLHTLIDSGFDPFDTTLPEFQQYDRVFDRLLALQHYDLMALLQTHANALTTNHHAINSKLLALFEKKLTHSKHIEQPAFKERVNQQVCVMIKSHPKPIELLSDFLPSLSLDAAFESLHQLDQTSFNEIQLVIDVIVKQWPSAWITDKSTLKYLPLLTSSVAGLLFETLKLTYHNLVLPKLQDTLKILVEDDEMRALANIAQHYLIQTQNGEQASLQEQLLAFITAYHFLEAIPKDFPNKSGNSLFQKKSPQITEVFQAFFQTMEAIRLGSGVDYWQSHCAANRCMHLLAKKIYPQQTVTQTLLSSALSDAVQQDADTSFADDPRCIIRLTDKTHYNVPTLLNWQNALKTHDPDSAYPLMPFNEIIAALPRDTIALQLSLFLPDNTPVDEHVAVLKAYCEDNALFVGDTASNSPQSSVSRSHSSDEHSPPRRSTLAFSDEQSAVTLAQAISQIKSSSSVDGLSALREELLQRRETDFGLKKLAASRYRAIINNQKVTVSGSWHKIETAFRDQYVSLINAVESEDELTTIKNRLEHPDFQFLRDFGKGKSQHTALINEIEQPVSDAWHVIDEAMIAKANDLQRKSCDL